MAFTGHGSVRESESVYFIKSLLIVKENELLSGLQVRFDSD